MMGDWNSKVGQIPGMEWNEPMTNSNFQRFHWFLREAGLLIVNAFPQANGRFTRFQDDSNLPGTMSVLDYCLVDSDSSNIIHSFTVDSDARFDLKTDHALLECQVLLSKVPHSIEEHHDCIYYKITPNTCYDGYTRTLDEEVSKTPFSSFSSLPLDMMLCHLTKSLNTSALKEIGVRDKRRKRSFKLPFDIVEIINRKNKMYRLYRNSLVSRIHVSDRHRTFLFNSLQFLKQQVQDALANFKLGKRNRLRSYLLLSDPSRKLFWKFLKSQTRKAGKISALRLDGQLVFNQKGKRNENIKFSEKV